MYIYLFTSADFTGAHTIELQNIVFTDASGTEYTLPNSSCVVTGPVVEGNEVELSIQDAYYNITTLYVEKGSVVKLKFVSTNAVQYTLNTVIFNGVDVVDELIDGVYTTPELVDNATLNVSYNIHSSQEVPLRNSNIKAYGYNGEIVVVGCEKGASVAVYDADGALLRAQYATDNTLRIDMPTDAVYMVKVADTAVKVAL